VLLLLLKILLLRFMVLLMMWLKIVRLLRGRSQWTRRPLPPSHLHAVRGLVGSDVSSSVALLLCRRGVPSPYDM